MKFDINSARSAGYSDDEIADYLATQNNFDLGGALKSGYSASEVIGFLSGGSAPAAPVTDTGDETARLAARYKAPERSASSLLPRPMDPLGLASGKPTGAAPATQTAAKPSAAPTPYRDRREALDDAVNLLEEGYDRAKVTESFSKAGITFDEISAHGKKRGSDYFKQQTAPTLDAETASLARRFPAPVTGEIKSTRNEENFPGADVALAGAKGAVTGFKLLMSAGGAGGRPTSMAEKALDTADQYLEGLRSAAAVRDDERIGQIMDQAKDGTWSEQVVAAAKAAGVAPASLIAQGLGTSVPVILTSLLPGIRESNVARLTAQIGLGAAQGAGATKESIYSAVKEDMLRAGVSKIEAEERADAAQSYLGQNKDQIAIGMALGALASSTGVERVIPIGQVSNVLAKSGVSRALASAEQNVIGRGLIGGLTEAAPEFLQGSAEQVAQNVALQREGRDIPTFQGAVGTGTLEALAGFGAGAVTNAAFGRPITPEEQIAREIDAGVAGTNFTSADPLVRNMLDVNAYDPTLVDPTQTARGGMVGPSAPINFTPMDSPSAQAGLAPIVVPVPAQQETPDVSATSVPPLAAAGSGQLASDQFGGGLDVPGSAVADTTGQRSGSAGQPGANVPQAGTVPGTAGEPATRLNRPFDRATDQDLMARTEASIASQENNNAVVQPVEQWFGRKGDGYVTQVDAQQALPGRQRMFPNLGWKVEPMANGKFRLAGYSATQENVSGNQAPQAVQGQAQGQEAPAAGAAAAIAAPVATANVQGPLPAGLKLAPPAPIGTIKSVRAALQAESGLDVAPVSLRDMSDSQKLASTVARLLGKTLTVITRVSGPEMSMPNGLINRSGGKHIMVADDTVDAPLFVTMHEAYHGLADDKRATLNTALRQLFREDKTGEFKQVFNYTDEQLDEEIPAFMVQAISKRPEFWEELRTKMGNKEFGEVAKVILDKLNQILTGARSEYGDDFVNKYITDVARARDLLTTAYAEAMQEQGLTPDVEVAGEVMASRRAKKAGDYAYDTDDKGRITVKGDVDRIKFLTGKIAKGSQVEDGVRFKAEDATAVAKVLKNAPKANPEISTEIKEKLGLTDAELASTSLEFQTGEPKDRAFDSPLAGGIPETVKMLEDRRRSSGLRLLDIANPEDQDTLAKLMAAETLAAIRSSGNALEWYDETIAKTLAMAAVKYPELGSDKNAQMVFRVAMAITSQGLNVENNLKFTMRQYDAFRTAGRFPEVGEGESGEAMVSNFKLINELLDPEVMGPDMLRRFLVTEFTIGELNQAGFDPGGELVDERVLGSSILGPKIGFGFYSNLNGNFEPVTMDMWFMRTIGRLTGNLRAFDAEKFAGQVNRFRSSLDQRGDDAIYADRFDADLVERARTEQDAAIELARQVKRAHERDFRDNRAEFDAGRRKKSQLVFAADTMIQSIDKPKDVPGNGMERRLLREVVRKAVAEVEKAYGQRIPPAAMQALIWYPEQELYKSMGVKLSVTSQDYAGATEKVLTGEGYDAKRLRAAAKSGSARVRQANVSNVGQEPQVDGQETRRTGPLEGAERERFIRERYEQAQLDLEQVNPKRKGVVFEVAPDPNNETLTAAWRTLAQAQRLEISERVARQVVPQVLSQLGTSGIITTQVGSYLDDTNPSFVVLLDKGDPVAAAKLLGFALAQDSMMVISPKKFPGGEQKGAIAIEVGDKTAAEVDAIYQSLRDIEVKGERPIAGQSMANGVMTILNYSDVPTEQLAILVDQKLNKGYTVLTREVFAAFPEKQEYDYGSEKDDGQGSRADLRRRARDLRAEATQAVEREISSARIQRSNRAAGPAEPARGPGARGNEAARPGTVTGIHYGKAAGLSRLNGSAFGTGIKGAEQARLNEPGVDPRIKKRVYFYLTNNNADMPRPEIGLGAHVYRATLGNMFDMSSATAAEKNRVQSLRKTPDANGFESAILNAGFRGYVNREQGTAVVLNADVPVAYEGMAEGSRMRDRTLERAVAKVTTRTAGQDLVRKPQGNEMMDIVKARPELAKVAPSFRLEFGEARVAQAEADAADRAIAMTGSSFRFGENVPVFEDAGAADAVIQYSRRAKPAPKKTVIAYKLFRVEKDRPGELFPLFVPVWGDQGPQKFSARDPRRHGEGLPIGEWYDAEVGENAPATKTGKPQVKSKLGGLAFRPGWHAGDLPIATHIGAKSDAALTAPDLRAPNQVWAEVELPDDVDWQAEATKRGVNKSGKFIAKEAHITDQIPEDGFYRYKTNSNMTGNWLIGGSMKVNRILSDEEVIAINDAADAADLPRGEPFDAKKYGFSGLVRSNRAGNIGAKLQAEIDANFDTLVAEYNQLDGTDGGRVLNTDIARELSPEYREDRTRSAEVHEAASDFIQRLFDKRVADAEPGSVVAFMAGGGGAGKSSAEYLLANKLGDAHTILDGTLSSPEKARSNVQKVLRSGQGAVIAYIYREPLDALRNGVLTRAMGSGRTVPIDALIKGHAGASTVVRRLDAEFGSNDRFQVYAVDNSKGAGNAEIVPLESITPVIMDGLKERFINATEEEFQAGKISEAVYRATVGGQADAGARAQAQDENAANRQGDSRDLQGRGGSERAGDALVRSNRRQKLVGSNFEVDATGTIDAARIKLQDDALRMKRVIEAVKAKGGTVGEAQNFYDANTLMPGRIQAAIDDFKTNIVRPMLDKAAEFGIDMDELSMYSYAKHAKERNAYIASINKRMPDGGSGMTNDEADNILQMVDLAGDTAKFEELHQALMSITSATRQVMLSEGLITPDEFSALEGAYENYIPLRGFENVDEETGVARPGVGRGVNIRGAETIRAMGRKSKAGDLIENVIRDYERVISRVEKNDVAKVLLDFVLSNPDPDLWGVDVERTKPGFNKAKGTVQYTKSIEKGEDTIGLKVGGEQVYIKFADKELTRALRQAWKDETSGLERATLAMTGWWNNWLRAVLTKYNPAFALINIPRDALWSGTASALAELGPKGLASYLAAYPKAFMASARQEAGFAGTSSKLFGNPQMDARFAEFRAAGGITGGFFMRTLDDINQELRNELLMAGASARNPWERIKSLPPFKLAKMTLKLLEFMGAASENATRFALYQASREQGNSPAKAGILAKDGTTNFNRKGEFGGALNNLYLFFNAAVQGNAQLFRVLKSPAVQASMAGVTGVGMMLALYGASSGGEDDDGEAYWDKIPSYIKERNMVIMLPPGDALAGGIERVGKRGRYITIPVQYGFNIFPNVGYVMADVLRNAQDPKRGMTPTKGALHLTSTVLGSINPFGGAVDVTDGVQVLLAAMPTLVDLPIQLVNERGTFGSPSSPQKSPFDLRPDSERMFTSQQDSVSAKIAEALNELGGGSEAKAGKIMGIETSVTPGTIQTLISATTGGLGTFIEQVGTSVISMTGDDQQPKASKIPFLNKFYGEVDEGANIKTAGDRMREVKKLSDEVKAQQKLGLDPKLTSEEDRLLSLAGMQATYQRQSTMIRKAELEIIKDDSKTKAEKALEKQRLQVERDKLATDMNREYLRVVPK